ncbi:ABC transporter substrate-binding protein [Neorhizobium sp. NCHU2750]|nr:ABC transporter substrate-binding protein [Neorhizobium sp. NCHU2750]
MRLSAVTIATAACCLMPLPAFAHPHIFVESRLEVIAGTDGNVQELRNVWRFDEVFSSSVLLDFDKNADLKLDEHELAELGETMRTSLAEFHYFTTLTLNGETIGVRKPDVIHTTFKDNQLLVFFAVKPDKPMPLKGKLTFGIYDPTMYTAVDFPSDQDLVADGPAFAKCKHQVVRPDPDQVIAQNSSTLTDAFFNDPTGTDMTKLFATRLELSC